MRNQAVDESFVNEAGRYVPGKGSGVSELKKTSLFLLEPSKGVRDYLERSFRKGYAIRLFSSSEDCLRVLREDRRPDVIVFGWEDADRSLSVLQELRLQAPEVPVIVLSCSSSLTDFELVANVGGCMMLLKPFVAEQLQLAIAKCLPEAVPEEEVVKEITLDAGHSFVRSNARMREIERQATIVARSDIPVLILGESGTGKEIIALLTHKMSRRSQNMFLKINCAAMPSELLESELFGYEQGAFTGALKTKPGKFEICDGGTIFLDEIGEMPAILQAKLLQVLQDGTFSRLGSRSTLQTNTRIIAATNINIKQSMKDKTFREDLYYRLNGLSILLPPLRERLDEIEALTAYFMRKGSQKYGFEEMPITSTLLAALGRYHWPGNLRELENVINRLLVLRDEGEVLRELAILPEDAHAETSAGVPATADGGGLKRMVQGVKGETESVIISNVLEQTGWNRKAAASDLQISYKALLYKIKQYDLSRRSA